MDGNISLFHIILFCFRGWERVTRNFWCCPIAHLALPTISEGTWDQTWWGCSPTPCPEQGRVAPRLQLKDAGGYVPRGALSLQWENCRAGEWLLARCGELLAAGCSTQRERRGSATETDSGGNMDVCPERWWGAMKNAKCHKKCCATWNPGSKCRWSKSRWL